MTYVETDDLARLYPSHLATVCERHDRALAAANFDAVIIAAGSPRMIFLDDMAYPFKVNAPFKAWVPVVDNPNCFVIYTSGRKPVLLYWQPVDYWHKPAANPKGFWVGEFDIRVIADPADARKHFPTGGKIAFIGDDDGIDGTTANPKALLSRLDWERSWKTDYEIECVRLANVRGARGHRAAERSFRDGDSEYEIHLAYLRASDQTEDELPYGNIIAVNENAAVLHYYHHLRERPTEERRFSFLIDAGGSVNGYASDITRTYSQNRDEFADLIAAVDEMQQGLVAMVRPTENYIDIHMAAHRGVAAILARFGFIRDLDVESIVDRGISSVFLPHGVGHFLGLQVHDVAGFMGDDKGRDVPVPDGHPFLRLTRTIDPRMLFTIEPGLYFIEPLLAQFRRSDDSRYADWSKIDAFRRYGGIRIEDDVVVTSGGCTNLTRDAFAQIA